MTPSDNFLLLAATAAVLLTSLIVVIVQFVRGRGRQDDRNDEGGQG